MPAADHRLTTLEVARFVAEGYLRFDALVPREVNEGVIDELKRLTKVKFSQAVLVPPKVEIEGQPASGTPLSRCYPAPSVLGEVLRLPEVLGIIASLVGEDPLFDHDFVHVVPRRGGGLQHLHVDALVDTSAPAFDIQLFYFPVDVPENGGGTRFVPGSHLKRVRAEHVAAYEHIVGEQYFSGPAGTVMVFHQGLWHAGQPNGSDRERWMYKIRLNPRASQVRLWNTDDLADVQNDSSDHCFATMRFDSVAQVLRQMQPWQNGHEARADLVQRVRLWRYLSGDDRFDADYYLTRLEQRAALLDGEG